MPKNLLVGLPTVILISFFSWSLTLRSVVRILIESSERNFQAYKMTGKNLGPLAGRVPPI
jgi:hypothetical protein